MGQLIKGALSLIGLGGTPSTSGAAAADLTAKNAASGDQQTAEYATAGGAAGEDIKTGQVSKRNTIFGN